MQSRRLKTSNKLLLIAVFSAALVWPSLDTGAVNAPALKERGIPEKPTNTTISPDANLRSVVVKFRDEVRARTSLSRGKMMLESRNGADMTPAMNVLQKHIEQDEVAPMFSISVSQLDANRARREAAAGKKLADLAGYYTIEVTSPAEAEELVNRLNALDVVEIAYPEPEPEPAGFFAPAAPDFSAGQDYLEPAPGGVDAYYAHGILGGDGTGVKFIDVEGGWRVTHEDFSGNPPFTTIGGQIADLGWRNHGTAVVGEIAGNDNGSGMTGIAPGVSWGYSSIGTQSTSNALLNAGNALDSGDVILIELHAPGPHYNFQSREDQLGYVCMEYFSANFDVIEQLFYDGIIVTEAAGNGAENYDDAGLYSNLFDTTFRNSHAIICGAGAPPSGTYGPDRTKLGFSCYGERVNLQGYGAGVYSCGYGGLYNGGTEDSWYTATFSGTSSASPIVTGAAIALQGAHKANYGYPMDADQIRTVFVNTGSPQTGGGHIGPRPDLKAALDEVLGVSFTADVTFGLAPFDVQFSGASTKNVLEWGWNFGDGDSSTQQSPQHTYNEGGLYSVSLGVMTDEGDFSTTRQNYVAVLADTIVGPQAQGSAGETIKIDVYARNALPVYQFKLPIEYAGPFNLELDSAKVDGLRSDGMSVALSAVNPFGGTATYTVSATGGLSSYMQTGAGPILSIYFTIPTGVSGVNPVLFDGYSSDMPQFATDWGALTPDIVNGQVSLCAKAGDADGSDAVNIADATYLISYIFASGPTPNPLGLGDANCDTSVNIADVTYLIAYIFSGGPAPCSCAP